MRGGYVIVHAPAGHPRADEQGRVPEHILIAERAVGHFLSRKVQVHHVDGDKQNNRGDNLVVCDSDAYHKLLHRRASALDACGDPNWRKCMFCPKYDDPARMVVHVAAGRWDATYCHSPCRRARYRSAQ